LEGALYGENGGESLMTQDYAQTAVNLSSLYTWKFDTCASSHMTSDIVQFHTLKLYHGTITIGANMSLQADRL